MRLLPLLLALCACSKPGEAPKPGPRTLRVRLTDAQGVPVAGVGQMVWWADRADAEYGTPVGVEGAVAVLKDIPDAPVVLVALPTGFVVPSKGWPRKVVPAGVTETDLVLDVGASRTLVVLNVDPKRSGLVYLAAVEDLEPSQHGIEDDGTVRIEGLREGVSYNLYVRESETDRCALLRALPANEPWPEIELLEGQAVGGRVLFPADCDLVSVALMVDKAAMIDAAPEEDGTFRIRGVPPGTWTAVAWATRGEDYIVKTAEVRAGGSVTLDLTKR